MGDPAGDRLVDAAGKQIGNRKDGAQRQHRQDQRHLPSCEIHHVVGPPAVAVAGDVHGGGVEGLQQAEGEVADRVLAQLAGQTTCIFVDLHAEATGDKAVLGRYLDGKVSAALSE